MTNFIHRNQNLVMIILLVQKLSSNLLLLVEISHGKFFIFVLLMLESKTDAYELVVEHTAPGEPLLAAGGESLLRVVELQIVQSCLPYVYH